MKTASPRSQRARGQPDRAFEALAEAKDRGIEVGRREEEAAVRKAP